MNVTEQDVPHSTSSSCVENGCALCIPSAERCSVGIEHVLYLNMALYWACCSQCWTSGIPWEGFCNLHSSEKVRIWRNMNSGDVLAIC